MEFQFEEFEHGPVVPTTERIHVTINARGNLYFNGRALTAMGEPDAVVMMYDRRQQVIGVKRSPLDRRNAFRLRRKDRDGAGGRLVYAANFCRFHHIKPDKTLAFSSAEVDKNGVLILRMRDVHVVKRK